MNREQSFEKQAKKIKKQWKDKQCWKCKHFNGFWYDNFTFDCDVLGNNQMWDFEGENCDNFIQEEKK